MNDRPPRRKFRIRTRYRNGYEAAVMYDVQLQVASTGAMVWARSFSHHDLAEGFRTQLESDLDTLDHATFRRKYSVPSRA